MQAMWDRAPPRSIRSALRRACFPIGSADPREMDMKRFVLLFACIGAACATPADVAAPAAPQPVAAAMTEAGVRPAACPTRTDVLYRPQVPQAGFVPAAPSGAAVAAPQRIHAADPAYPAASRRCREEGKVVITYCISAEGRMD